MALAKKYNVTPTQVVLSWHIGRGTGVVAKSENASRQEENLKVSLEMGMFLASLSNGALTGD